MYSVNMCSAQMGSFKVHFSEWKSEWISYGETQKINENKPKGGRVKN